MNKIVLIPDSFKGTLASGQICQIMAQKIHAYFPHCQVVAIPVADGGEGSVDCFLSALGGEKVSVTVKGPYFDDMPAFYGLIDHGHTAVIEMAACAGLPLVEDRKNPMLTTTYGVGQLILAAAEKGCKKIVVGLGGSRTNDAGTGAAAAIGIKFFNRNGEAFIPTGGTLKDIAKIDAREKAPVINDVEIVAMCDIDNPMYGQTGAAYIFAPQKGADREMVKALDEGLVAVSRIIARDLAICVASIPGGGAAGAMGAGMVAFFHADLQMGIETVLDAVKFDAIIADADMIFTGEGKLDAQSLRGKVVIGVAKRAKKQNVPVTVVVGGYDTDLGDAYAMGVTSVFSINRLPEDFARGKLKSAENLALTMDNILRFLKNLRHG